MTFLHPGIAIAGLLAVSLPIIIHIIMRRRRRPVMWGAMRFLLEAYRRQRKRLLFEQWLLLASRCLLVLLAAMAIAHPLLAGGRASGAAGRTVYILIDNSMTASARGTDGSESRAIERHKELAKGILSQLSGRVGSAAGNDAAGAGDRAALIAMAAPAEALVSPPSPDIAAVSRLVDSVEATDSRSDPGAALALAVSAIESDRSRRAESAPQDETFVVVISDFLDGSVDIAAVSTQPLPRLPDGVRLLVPRPAATATDNLAIGAVEPLRGVLLAPAAGTGASGAGGVRVSVRRSGPGVSRELSVPVNIRLAAVGERPSAGSNRPVTGLARFRAGQEETAITLQPPAVGDAQGPASSAVLVAQIEHPETRPGEAATAADSISDDNVFRRPIELRESLRVGLVAPKRFGERGRVDELEAAEWLRLALNPGGAGGVSDSGIEVIDIEPGALDLPRLAGLDAVALPRPDLITPDAWRRLRGFAAAGGLLLITPPGGEAGSAAAHTWTDAMVNSLSLPFAVSRETRVYDPGDPAARLVVNPAPGSGTGGESADVLSLVRAELAELARPVTVSRLLPIEIPAGTTIEAGERLLSMPDGSVVLWVGSPSMSASGETNGEAGSAKVDSGAQGLIVYLAAAPELDWTDLPARPLMVPLVQELIRQGVGRARGTFTSIAGRPPSLPSRTAELLRIPDPLSRTRDPAEEAASARISVDAATGRPAEPLRRAGLWRAVDERGAARGVVGVNPDSRASRVTPQPAADIERWLRGASEVPPTWIEPLQPGAGQAPAMPALASARASGSPFALPLLIAAGLLAMLETIVARHASHATLPATVPDGERIGAASAAGAAP
ncbi:MAG: BatA domain-containing protein [Phycisphaeraceae bacterium]|nr:BatA domain-containing protein [Phycisphaeraceae bacterium]